MYDLTDALGSVVLSFSAGAIQGEQLYGPYGNQRYIEGVLGTDKGYTGQFADSVTGLDYYNARWYDPVSGRFLSPDTVQGNAQGMDPYAYVEGNPETRTDPTGQDGCGFWCMATGVLTTVAIATAVVGVGILVAATAPVSLTVGVIALGVAGGILGGEAGSYINYEISYPGTPSNDKDLNRAVFKGGIVGGIIGGLSTACAVAFAMCGGAGAAAMTYETAADMGPGAFLVNVGLNGVIEGTLNGVTNSAFGAEVSTADLAAAQEKDPARKAMEARQAKEHVALLKRLRANQQRNIQHIQNRYGSNWRTYYDYAVFEAAVTAEVADNGAPVRFKNMNIS